MTRRRRQTSDEEAALFRASLGDGIPPTPAKVIPKPEIKPAAKAPQPPKPAGPSGLDGRTQGRLRRGLLEPEARLDLHGMTEVVAHRSLTAFVKSAHARGLRLILVVNGKGSSPDRHAPFDMGLAERGRGILSLMAPRWLAERELASLIAEFRRAHRRHGGDGALYIYLRKT